VISVDDFVTCDSERWTEWVAANRERGGQRVAAIPARFVEATVTHPAVRSWLAELVGLACKAGAGRNPSITSGPSLRLLGGTGTGKTHQAFGVLRAVSESGAACRWVATTATDVYARMRPRHGVDSEAEFERFAGMDLLVLDDVGAARPTEWIEEVNYRLINRRYEEDRPTLFTSNLTPAQLSAVLGERVMSRLVGMSTQVVLEGPDRRRPR
jgi:DNA replication protein DnaC